MDGNSFTFVIEYCKFGKIVQCAQALLSNHWYGSFTWFYDLISALFLWKARGKKQWVLKMDDSYGWFFFLSSSSSIQMCTFSTNLALASAFKGSPESVLLFLASVESLHLLLSHDEFCCHVCLIFALWLLASPYEDFFKPLNTLG